MKGSIWLISILSLFFLSACSSADKSKADKLNDLSYYFHYRDLDSTLTYAEKALKLSSDYPAGKAEAYNNIAFVHIAKMEYDKAYGVLDSVVLSTDNQVELLVADIQYMRLCQRESKNKNFYDYRERALARFKRIEEDKDVLSERLLRRLVYAKTEFQIVCSTYYYYVGLTKQAEESIKGIDPSGEIQKDTAQYLNYLYQIGSGGLLTLKTQYETMQAEFNNLLKCYILAKQYGLVYWQANSLQSLSEHLLTKSQRTLLISRNTVATDYLNEDHMPDSLLAGNLAQRALNLFIRYGDVYQTAGAYRTLSFCYWELGDFTSSLICLENALVDKKIIEQAPDLVASIKELLSLVYSAMDDKNNSDINRNEYLDLQELTRQDQQLEARAEQLEKTSMQLNILIVSILILIVCVVVLLLMLRLRHKKKNQDAYIESLLIPLHEWKERNILYVNELAEKHEAINEQLALCNLHIEKNKRAALDNKAKIFLVNNVVPYIDRIINEVKRLNDSSEEDELRHERYVYVGELADKINEYNNVLTHLIQLQQGQLRLKIESFNLKDVFNIIAKSGMSFSLKGVTLNVTPADIMVKADKVLTLFMLNTLADNARKFTPEGGKVVIEAHSTPDFVEVSVEDTGIGLTEDELSGIFDHKVYNGHGFGLMNCRGIMDNYRKVSKVFDVCGLFAESSKNHGSRFFFRLPHGVVRMMICLLVSIHACVCVYADGIKGRNRHVASHIESVFLKKAGEYADSAYYSNISGTYERTLSFADSARSYLNRHYKHLRPDSRRLMVPEGNSTDVPAEIMWFRDNVKTDYDIVLDVRNETAVAALALHKWNLYKYNNKVYTQLFKEKSADRGLAGYCLAMQRSSTNKTVAVIVLVLLLLTIVCVYYFFYYRRILHFRFCVEHIRNINTTILSEKLSDEDKYKLVNAVDTSKYPEELKNVVGSIKNALRHSVELNNSRNTGMELAEDELRRARYEADQLHISNNVIDNCLSTLKHETMYYPSRIRQLVDDSCGNTHAISEVASYYKELYSILCEQVRRQADGIGFECKRVSLAETFGVEGYVMGDKALISYLYDILKKQTGFKNTDVSVSFKKKGYAVINILCRDFLITEEQCRELFSPSVNNIPFIICRQIVRESSELAGLHGCGICAEPADGEGTLVCVTLAGGMQNANGS